MLYRMDVLAKIMLTWSLGIMSVFVDPACCFNVSDGSALQTYLLNGYNRFVRPSTTVDIELEFHLLTINQLDVRTQKLSTSGWFTLTWTDSRFNWSSSSYSNILEAYVHEDNVWLPQIVVDNTFDKITSMSGSNLLLRVTSQGLVTWEPPCLYNTHCSVDTTWFPFDVQTCMLSVSGWSYNVDELNVTNRVSHISTNDYRINGEWLLSSTYISSTPKDGRSHLNLVIQLERRSAFYVMNVLVPVLLTSLLTPMIFKLPSESGERVSFILTVVLALEVLLTIVSAHMPATSLHTSVMEVYLVMVLSISALAVILTSLVLNLYHRGDDMELPKVIRLMLKWHKDMKRRTQIRSTKEETGHDMNKPCNQGNDESSPRDGPQTDNYMTEEFDKVGKVSNQKITCRELSKHLDEIFFWMFFGLTLLCTLIFMLTMGLGGS